MKRLILLLMFLMLGSLVAQAGMELTSARLYRKQGEYQKALDWYDREIAANPNSLAGHYEKGELLGEMADEGGRPELFIEMRKEFDAVLNITDPKAKKKLKKFRSKIKEQVDKYWIFRYNEAVEESRLADSDSALDASVKELAGDTWETLGNSEKDSLCSVAKDEYYKKTLEILDFARIIDPNRWEAYALLSNIYSARDEWEAAEASLRDAIEKHVSPAEGEAKKSASQQTEAEWQRTHLDMMENLAQISYERKNYEETIKTCDEILAMDPQNILATKFLAFSWNQLGESEKAVDAYQKAIAAQPDNANLLYDAGQLYMQAGDTAGAVKCFSDFIALNPTDAEIIFQLGIIYLEGGSFADNEKAKEVFGNATKNFPDNPAFWVNYGVALIRLGETEEGKKAIEKAKELKGE